MLKTYDQFIEYVDEIGFMPLSNNPLGFPNLSMLTNPEQWHTGLETDPWQWRIRIVQDRRAAYAKLFHGLPSFISQQWYPAFLAIRRGASTVEELYHMGLMGSEARRIDELFRGRSLLAGHEIKQLGGFTASSKSKFDGAMTALQMGMFITTSGMTRMTTLDGRPHSWPVTEYQRMEDWAWPGTMDKATEISRGAAEESITRHILDILPQADRRKVDKFIGA